MASPVGQVLPLQRIQSVSLAAVAAPQLDSRVRALNNAPVTGTVFGLLSGDDWQRWVIRLLKMRYRLEFVEFPDRDKGDFGLEGFCRSGTAFQCYGPEEPLDVATLYEKHRIKITTDLQKLKKNRVRIKSALGGTLLSRWHLVVPRNESVRIQEHAGAKSIEVRSWGLDFITPDFAISVITDDYFEIERNMLATSGLHTIRVSTLPATAQQVSAWARSRSTLVAVLDEKLLRLPAVNPATLDEHRLAWLQYFLDGENAIEQLERDYGEVFDQFVAVKSRHERALAVREQFSTTAPSERLTIVLNEFREDVRREVSGLDLGTVDTLMFATTADWLLRCPLRFPTSA